VRQGHSRVNHIPVTPADLLLGKITRFFQIVNNILHGPDTKTYFLGYHLDSTVTVLSQIDKNQAVIRKKFPVLFDHIVPVISMS